MADLRGFARVQSYSREYDVESDLAASLVCAEDPAEIQVPEAIEKRVSTVETAEDFLRRIDNERCENAAVSLEVMLAAVLHAQTQTIANLEDGTDAVRNGPRENPTVIARLFPEGMQARSSVHDTNQEIKIQLVSRADIEAFLRTPADNEGICTRSDCVGKDLCGKQFVGVDIAKSVEPPRQYQYYHLCIPCQLLRVAELQVYSTDALLNASMTPNVVLQTWCVSRHEFDESELLQIAESRYTGVLPLNPFPRALNPQSLLYDATNSTPQIFKFTWPRARYSLNF